MLGDPIPYSAESVDNVILCGIGFNHNNTKVGKLLFFFKSSFSQSPPLCPHRGRRGGGGGGGGDGSCRLKEPWQTMRGASNPISAYYIATETDDQRNKQEKDKGDGLQLET